MAKRTEATVFGDRLSIARTEVESSAAVADSISPLLPLFSKLTLRFSVTAAARARRILTNVNNDLEMLKIAKTAAMSGVISTAASMRFQWQKRHDKPDSEL